MKSTHPQILPEPSIKRLKDSWFSNKKQMENSPANTNPNQLIDKKPFTDSLRPFSKGWSFSINYYTCSGNNDSHYGEIPKHWNGFIGRLQIQPQYHNGEKKRKFYYTEKNPEIHFAEMPDEDQGRWIAISS